ncbi:unnamed protein product [Notodromas monacha]|uniref:Large ribosomal subunit protein eL38 n=1 Tax=Notodromas monacha TaxID=399045 RepID=A0A7R9BTG8_9CRUS|nr:unnamed protein product [Notodromas monacha]CAG0921443.1 unnamed protein product [Notodromas monacha]
MPREIKEIKDFLLTARRKDAKSVKIKKNPTNTKFKVRCSRFLYTLVVTDKEKADKLKQSLPPGLQVKELKREKVTKRGKNGRVSVFVAMATRFQDRVSLFEAKDVTMMFNSSQHADKDSVPYFLRNLPSFNKENFTRYKADSSSQKKPIGVYVSTVSDPSAQVIVNDDTNILLRHLRREATMVLDSGVKRHLSDDRGDRKRIRLSDRTARPSREN